MTRMNSDALAAYLTEQNRYIAEARRKSRIPGSESIQDAFVEMNSPDQRQRRIAMCDWVLASCKALAGIALMLAIIYLGALI